MMIDRLDNITWTVQRVYAFKRAYFNAVNHSQSQFTFDGKQFVTAYAKYLIEYLAQRGIK